MSVLSSVAEAPNRTGLDVACASRQTARRRAAASAVAEAQANAFTFAAPAQRHIRKYTEVNSNPTSSWRRESLLNKAAGYFGDRPVRNIKQHHRIDPTAQAEPVGPSGLTEDQFYCGLYGARFAGLSTASDIFNSIQGDATGHAVVRHGEALSPHPGASVVRPMSGTRKRRIGAADFSFITGMA